MFLEYFPYSLLFVSIFKKKQIVVKLKQVIFTTFVSSVMIVQKLFTTHLGIVSALTSINWQKRGEMKRGIEVFQIIWITFLNLYIEQEDQEVKGF